jgi:hypothetical protein
LPEHKSSNQRVVQFDLAAFDALHAGRIMRFS